MEPKQKQALKDLAETIQNPFDGGRALENLQVLLESRDGQAIVQHAMGAEAYALGNRIGLTGTPDLQLAAHEAHHVIQQNQSALEFLRQRAERP